MRLRVGTCNSGPLRELCVSHVAQLRFLRRAWCLLVCYMPLARAGNFLRRGVVDAVLSRCPLFVKYNPAVGSTAFRAVKNEHLALKSDCTPGLPLQALRRGGRARDAMRSASMALRSASRRVRYTPSMRPLAAHRCDRMAGRPALRFTPSTRPLATAAIPVDENDVPILGAATRARELAPELYRRLFELGEPYVVFDDVLGNDVRGAMLEDALALRRRDRFGPSQSVGSDGVPFDKEAVLSCEVEPTDFDDAPHLLAFTRDWLLTLPPALNALLGAERVSPREYGTKLAVQMASGRYPRHVDNACVDGGGPRDKRWITCIYYLQEPGSGVDAGGALRIYVGRRRRAECARRRRRRRSDGR